MEKFKWRNDYAMRNIIFSKSLGNVMVYFLSSILVLLSHCSKIVLYGFHQMLIDPGKHKDISNWEQRLNSQLLFHQILKWTFYYTGLFFRGTILILGLLVLKLIYLLILTEESIQQAFTYDMFTKIKFACVVKGLPSDAVNNVADITTSLTLPSLKGQDTRMKKYSTI